MTNKVVPINRPEDAQASPPVDADEAVAAELMADIMRLAKQCEKLSGVGYSSEIVEARSASDLKELAELRDGLVEDLASYKAARSSRRSENLEIALPFIAIGAVALLCIAVIFTIPVLIKLFFSLIRWLN